MLESQRPGRGKLSIPQDCSLEQLLTLQQQYLMFAPYSRQLRQLKRFANRHSDPNYGTAFNLKLDLFEKQQQEFRPNCMLSGSMYRFEKTLGRIFSSRAITPLFALTFAAFIAAGYRYPHLLTHGSSQAKATDNLVDFLAAYEMRVVNAEASAGHRADGDPPSRTKHLQTTPNEQFMQQLLNCLKEPRVREALAKELHSIASNRTDQPDAARESDD
jgi:hypothetical protein